MRLRLRLSLTPVVVLLAMTLTMACGGGADVESTSSAPVTATTDVAPPAPASTETPAPTPTPQARSDPADPVSVSEFDRASESEKNAMFESGRILKCRVGLTLPRDSFCIDAGAASLSDISFLVAHLPSGDGLVLQGGARMQVGATAQLGWITYEMRGSERVITHLDP